MYYKNRIEGEYDRKHGDSPNYEIACDECDFYLNCFPDWREFPIS